MKLRKALFPTFTLFIYFISTFAVVGFSQENQFTIDSVQSVAEIIRINDDIHFVNLNIINQEEKSVFKIDKSQNSISLVNKIPSVYFYHKDIVFMGHETGMFYASKYILDGNQTSLYNVNWMDLNGNISTSPRFSKSPNLLGTNGDDLFYYRELNENELRLEKFNSTTSQREQIETFSSEIIHFQSTNGIPYFVSKIQPNSYEFFSYNETTGVTSEFSFYSSKTYFRFLGEHNNLHYFSTSSGQEIDVWEVDFTQKNTQLYAQLPRFSYIDIAQNSFYSNSVDKLFLGDLSNPNQIDTIHFTNTLVEDGARIQDYVNNKVLRGYTNSYGMEPFYISDSIYLLKNIAQGIKSGWINTEINHPDYFNKGAYFINNQGIDSCYTIMSNFNDNLNYLYSINDTTIHSYFPISDPKNIINPEVYHDNFYWYTTNEDKFTFHWRSLINNLEPQPTENLADSSLTWGINLPYLHKRFGYYQNDRQQNSQVKLLKDGSVLSAVRMAASYDYKIVDENHNILNDAHGSFLVYKHDSIGNMEWYKSFGPKYFGGWADNPLLVDIDENEDIYVSGVFFKDYNSGNDSLEINRAGNFIHKLDGQTGETIWFKIISQNFYYDDFHIDKLKIINNEIVLAFSYKDFKCIIDGFQLINEFASPINAIAKFDIDGSLIFAKNIPTEWTNYDGSTWILDNDNDQIFASQSQGAYNISSSCEYHEYGYFNQIINSEGEVTKTISEYSSDIGAATAGFFEDNNIFAFGRYRGELDLGYFNNTTPFGKNCNLSRGFMYRYDLEKDEFSELKISHEEFYPFDAKYFGDFYYVYGRGENKELTLVKFDKNGKEIGYKRLGQYMDELTFNAYQFFDISDKYIAIIGDQFQQNEEFKVPKIAGIYRHTSVIKALNDNWNNDKKLFWNTERIFSSNIDDNLVVYPNPFTEDFSIMFKDPIYTDLEIYDLNGRQLKRFDLNKDFVQKFSFSDVPQGIYLFKIFNEEISKTVKIIKQ